MSMKTACTVGSLRHIPTVYRMDLKRTNIPFSKERGHRDMIMLGRTDLFQVLALLSACWLNFSNAAIPELLWNRRLPGSTGTLLGTGLRKGNGVVASKDGHTLWVTDELGTLHIIDLRAPLSDESTVSFRLGEHAEKTMECRSSVALYETKDGVEYAVFAVIDVPLSNQQGTGISSRIIAVNGKGNSLGSLRWKRKVSGVVVGTPVIGTDGKTIYVSQNSNDRGTVVILSDDNGGKVVARESDALFGHYGPLTLNKVGGKDIIYWGELNGRGYSDMGRIHYLDASTQVHHIGNDFGSSSTTPPTLSSDSTSMWVGGKSGTVYGWTGGNFKDNPSWTTQLQLSRRNHTFPIVNRIATNEENDRIYVTSASSLFHCIDAASGKEVWSSLNGKENGFFLTSPQYSPKDDMIYTIQHADGMIVKQEASTGKTVFLVGCIAANGPISDPSCQNSVEAEFSLSPDGTTLYFSDIFGNLKAVAVAESSLTPSSTPKDASPTQIPTATVTENLDDIDSSPVPSIQLVSKSVSPSVTPIAPTTSSPVIANPQVGPPTRAPSISDSQTPIYITPSPTIYDDLLKSGTGDSPVISFDDDLLFESGALHCRPALFAAGCLVIAFANIF